MGLSDWRDEWLAMSEAEMGADFDARADLERLEEMEPDAVKDGEDDADAERERRPLKLDVREVRGDGLVDGEPDVEGVVDTDRDMLEVAQGENELVSEPVWQTETDGDRV